MLSVLDQQRIKYEYHDSSTGPRNKSAMNNGISTIDAAHPPQSSPRASFSVHKDIPFTNMYTPFYTCRRRPPLHPHMHETFNFTTKISTDLKVLIMGDSVGIQFAQGLQEAADAVNRTILRYTRGEHEGLFVATVNGGGIAAGWRITSILAKGGENRPIPNNGGGGWLRQDAVDLLHHNYTLPNETEARQVGSLDTIVFRIPHGWMTLQGITKSGLEESVQVANELFGVKHVIFITLPFVSNILTSTDLIMLQEKNEMIRDLARSWDFGRDGVESVLAMEFGRFADSLVEWNARLMGINTTRSYYLIEEHLECCPDKGFSRSIPQVCSERVEVGAKNCQPNLFSLDGLHWCSETMNGHFNAALACLLQCPFQDSLLRECEADCNDRFMSLEILA